MIRFLKIFLVLIGIVSCTNINNPSTLNQSRSDIDLDPTSLLTDFEEGDTNVFFGQTSVVDSQNAHLTDDNCRPIIESSHAGQNGTDPSLAFDQDINTRFVSTYNDWQSITIDFQCIREFRWLKRHMSFNEGNINGIRGHRTPLQGEGVLYSIDGSTWHRLVHTNSFGWEAYNDRISPRAWYELPYGWSSEIYLSEPAYARFVRFAWDGDNDELNEIDIEFGSRVVPETPDVCSPMIESSHIGKNDTNANMVFDRDINTRFVSIYNDWQSITIDFQCIREFRGLKRHMSFNEGNINGGNNDNIRGHNVRLQGERVFYSVDGSTWHRLVHTNSFGWEAYNDRISPRAWYELPYGWSRWIVPIEPSYARFVRFAWDGDNDELNELDIQFGERVFPETATTSVSYIESFEDFPNPERGFYQYSLTRMSNYQFLTEQELSGYRVLHSPQDNPGPALYQVHSTLIYRAVILDDLATNADIEALKQNLELDFASARAAGVKYILRFAYRYFEPTVCDDYEPAKATIESHIQQLGMPVSGSSEPFFTANKDVIALFQFGFIGNYGEGYYSAAASEFGCKDTSLNSVHWQNRIDLLNAFLLVTPPDRMVQVRTMQLRQKLLGGTSATTDVVSQLNDSNAFDGSLQARIGFYNDCFLGGNGIEGFASYDENEILPSDHQAANLRTYTEANAPYVAIFGETCSVNNNYDNCPPGGEVINELERFHLSSLSSGWNYAVNNDWVSGQCINEISRRLGYRFVLKNGTFTTGSIEAGQLVSLELSLTNVGFASPFNPRPLEIILKNEGNEYFVVLNEHPQHWQPGSIEIEAEICTPENMPFGEYSYFLNLPDNAPNMATRPEYSIKLANTHSIFDNKGHNSLNASVLILPNNVEVNPDCEYRFIRRD